MSTLGNNIGHTVSRFETQATRYGSVFGALPVARLPIVQMDRQSAKPIWNGRASPLENPMAQMSIVLSYNAMNQSAPVDGIMNSAGPAITLFVNIPRE